MTTPLLSELAKVRELIEEAESTGRPGGKCVEAANKAYYFLRTHAAAIEGLARKAERYDFLRDNALDTWDVTEWIDNETQRLHFGADMDASIDAAIAALAPDTALRGEGK